MFYGFKEELSNEQEPPEEQDGLRKKRVDPEDGGLTAQAWQGCPTPTAFSQPLSLGLQRSRPHLPTSEVVPMTPLLLPPCQYPLSANGPEISISSLSLITKETAVITENFLGTRL